MQIRLATLSYIDEILELLKLFHEELRPTLSYELDEQSTIWTIKTHITQPQFRVFLLFDDGMKLVGILSGAQTPMIFNANIQSFFIICWYVLPEYRGKNSLLLLKHVETYCANYGIQIIGTGSNGTKDKDRFEKMYTRRGYRLHETHYMADIKKDLDYGDNSERCSKEV